jgi:hypothetical protein
MQAAIVVAGVILGACSAPGRQQSAGSSTVASARATTAVGSPTPVEPTTTQPPTAPPIAAPPDASIAVDGGDPVVGVLGTFTWHNAGSDAPWLDGAPLHVGAGEQLALSLARPIAIERWTAGRTTPGSLDGSGAIGLAEGTGGLPRFAAPPPGTWSVQVNVWFAGGQGSAAYYWLVEVD